MMRKAFVCYLVIALFIIGIVPRVDAAFSPSDAFTLGPSARAGDVDRIRTVLENKLIRQRLKDLGYSTEEITSRLAQLSDQEVHAIARKLDDLKVGGDGLGFVIAILVIVVLVILILQLTGHKVLVK